MPEVTLPDEGLVPVRVELGTVVIGPVRLPGRPGCATCAELRRRRAREHDEAYQRVWDAHGPSPSLTGLAVSTVAALVAEQAADVQAGRTPRAHNALLRIDLGTLAVSTHPFLPDPLCPDCGDLPDDTAESARITPSSRPKPAGTYRTRALAAEHDALLRAYVDGEVGLIRPLARWNDGGVVIAAAPMGLRTEDRVETGFGLGRDYRAAETAAVAEALERYGGIMPGGKRTTVIAPYAEIAGHAVDPRTFGLYPPDRYAVPGFAFIPFDECTPCRWVWGYSFARREPVLVPESYAYYHTRLVHPDEPRFAYEVSNGCALGASIEEAIFHGILEIAERDAFLMTWYARLPAPRVSLADTRDPNIPLLAAAITEETGYRLLAFDITLEQRIPSVWLMAVDDTGDPLRPKVSCAAGAHLDPDRALAGALHELAPALTSLIRHYPQRAGHARALARDSTLVSEMDDHALLYANPEVFDRFDFLTAATETRPFGDSAPRRTDLREDLEDLLHRYLDSGLDVIVVDQTTPEHRAADFACVKVIIPGTLPMTFGHHNRRTHDLPRLYEVPPGLGYPRPDGINPYPHPFP
ncbi:MAG TPA: TOMM precursor leader peptide-binding protein [Actinophytocola sp.]|jgi:ribosomal protein S12 methylthiotransferase accessory factor|uniref:TOMM precursor leader peptide-binding protein n=1 Tax=Actinophytocola sp. TaxID=1872138 RepID=UPI002E06730C|nr:TOMM precursor leader peptide-binding protein [Actinophytocola sp.]